VLEFIGSAQSDILQRAATFGEFARRIKLRTDHIPFTHLQQLGAYPRYRLMEYEAEIVRGLVGMVLEPKPDALLERRNFDTSSLDSGFELISHDGPHLES
jgi:hypothetical protein